ncbi:4'-phosphopantetheinyl transferase family protein [Kribbella soli]|uniref:4'-phosphopantetheinyl transferase superfamily protein n=1 Tax=Kribbella soli TaxID=1124743 RepID=A0A4R0HKH4_9ACTN|nr:4'-phosphopantetheinyl transferase superfamily protein [Kribbella soli]TCC10718.1 4'-phosphopantetheinyl transferase superfamily protein [Kribbella soli]
MGSSVYVWLAAAGVERGAAAHDLLLELAGTLVDRPMLVHDEAGRPHIPGLAVSISYTQHLIAVAAAYSGPVGVDLEEVRARDFEALAGRWFAPRELEWMRRQGDELVAFLQLWTGKEAVGKALGQGLRGSGLRREMPLGGGAVKSAPGLVVTHLPWPGAVLAVAAPAGHAVLTRAARDVEVGRRSPTLDPPCARG